MIPCSALKQTGIDCFWQQVIDFQTHLNSSGEFDLRRQRQALDWFWNLLDSGLRNLFNSNPDRKQALQQRIEAVSAGSEHPTLAAQKLLSTLN